METAKVISLQSLLNRPKKIFRDHVFRKEHDWQLKVPLAGIANKWPAADHDMEFFPILSINDPRLHDVARDFPKQSKAFSGNFADGCILLCVGQGTNVLGYFVVALQDFYDADCFRVTFPASKKECYSFNLFVSEENRNKSVARVVVSEGFAWLGSQGYESTYAMCSAANKPLVRFYSQMGMKPTGRALDQYVTKVFTFSRWTDKREVAGKRQPKS